jgi:DNA (cytosine-5)-methyltransferase 1
MTAYYNEIDPYNAAWLRELINQNLIAPGDVDERSIEDVKPDDLKKYTQCHFFAGIGVWSRALRDAGWADDRPVWTGSCPCQPFSSAGKRKGFADERNLWPAWFHLITVLRPATIFGEQVASKVVDRWVDIVQDDLEALDYPFGAVPYPAASVCAPQIRDRLYWIADACSEGWERPIHNDRVPESSITPQPVNSDEMFDAWSALGTDFSHIRKRDGATPAMERRLLHGYGNAIHKVQATEFVKCFV